MKISGMKLMVPVSDTAFKDESADKSGPALVTLLQEAGLSCPNRQIVPDEVQRIQHFVKLWSDAGLVDLLITTGGTGFGVRDRTPEVTSRYVILVLSNFTARPSHPFSSVRRLVLSIFFSRHR